MGAIGSAVDSDEDAQQMMLPVTMPLIFSIYHSFCCGQKPGRTTGFLGFNDSIHIAGNHDGKDSFRDSGLADHPFDDIAALQTILGTIWMAGKIYRDRNFDVRQESKP